MQKNTPGKLSDIDIRVHPVADVFWKTISEDKFVNPALYHLRLQAEHALLVSGFDELICLDQLHFVPFDYQVRAAQIVLRRFRSVSY